MIKGKRDIHGKVREGRESTITKMIKVEKTKE